MVGWRSGSRAACLAIVSLALFPAAGLSQEPAEGGATAQEPAEGGATAQEPTAGSAASSGGQEEGARGSAWFPSRSVFWDLLGPPRANGLWAALIDFEMEAGPFSGRKTRAAEVQMAWLMVVRRFQSEAESRPGVDLGLDFIITPRFNLDEPQKDLINTDFRVGIPISVAYRRFQMRLGYLHESSHLGDETVLRFTIGTLEQSSRDALEATVTYQVAELGRVYVGGGWNWNRSDSNESLLAWTGFELDPGRIRSSLIIWPYVAADFRITDLTARVAGTLSGGGAFRVAGRILRLELRGHFGPSPMGQFRTTDEDYFGAAIRFEPFPPH